MYCERVQDHLSDYLDGSLPESELQEVAAHLRDCRQCLAAAEGLKETLALLRRLPPGKAPPELLEGVRRRIAREGARKPLWKRLFLPAHIKIPLEAAAAVLLFLLVYGSQKGETPKVGLPPSAALVEAPADADPGRRATEGKEGKAARTAAPRAKDAERTRDDGAAESAPGYVRRPEPPSQERLRKREAAGPGTSLRGGSGELSGRESDPASRTGPVRVASAPRMGESAPLSASPLAPASLPAVPAQRVSTAGDTIEPAVRSKRQEEDPALHRPFAAPPSRLMRPLPFGREVTIEVTPESRAGLEDRIASAALRLGGSAHREPERAGSAADAVRVHVPGASAEPFLAELRKLGTIPPEGAPGWADFPAGPSPEIVVYTVRIRVR